MKFKIGDRVRVDCPWIRYPRYGWGLVKPRDIGTIVAIREAGMLAVNFPSFDHWLADESELVLCNRVQKPKEEPAP